MLPCSSLAIRSASSINSVPKPYQSIKGLFSPRKSQTITNGRGKTDLMLELGRITTMHRHSRAIHMELSYNAATPF